MRNGSAESRELPVYAPLRPPWRRLGAVDEREESTADCARHDAAVLRSDVVQTDGLVGITCPAGPP
jgi:hypothetical protein